ncbi:MAG: alpha/beta hydrolase [Bacillota bacterium]
MESYKNYDTWKRVQKYLPEYHRLNNDIYPEEKYWHWKNFNIHLDYYKNNSSKHKVILLHGVGGNGRLLSFIAVPLYKNGIEVICPDLPGYGLTKTSNINFDYSTWVELLKDLIRFELKRDNKDIILVGLSAGGMLAYHAGCIEDITGMVFTNLLDQRIQIVRDESAANKILSRVGLPVLKLISRINDNINIPMKLVSNMNKIVNNNDLLNILLKDKKSSGAKVPIRFITSMLEYCPDIEPETFNGCPVLLLHPENDRWTDLSLSKLTFDKFNIDKEIKILENAGHFPIEEPGITKLYKSTYQFIQNIDKEKGDEQFDRRSKNSN